MSTPTINIGHELAINPAAVMRIVSGSRVECDGIEYIVDGPGREHDAGWCMYWDLVKIGKRGKPVKQRRFLFLRTDGSAEICEWRYGL